MSAFADTGFGITIEFASGFLAEIIDFTPPAESRDAIDTSHSTTPQGRRTKIPGDLIDSGEAEVTIAFHPDKTVPIDQPPEAVTINFPSGTTWDFQGFMTNHAPAAPIDDRMTADVTIAASGPITITPAA
jgi:hypothetical protein